MKVRAPHAEDPIQALMALCSDSTGHKLGIQMTVGDHFGKVFNNVRLGSNGVCRNHVDITKSCRLGACNGDFDTNLFGHVSRPPLPW